MGEFRLEIGSESDCQNATGHEWQCSCVGERYGAGNDGAWFEVSVPFSMRWRKCELACRPLAAR